MVDTVLPRAAGSLDSVTKMSISARPDQPDMNGQQAVDPTEDAAPPEPTTTPAQQLIALVEELRSRPARPVVSSYQSGNVSRKAHGRKESASTRAAYDASAPTQSDGVGSGGAAGPSVLDTLDLCHRKIDKLPEKVVQMIQNEVVRLALGYNLLTSLPPSFAKLNRLRYLNIRANLLTTFPSVITELPCIEILDISRNKIKSLPEEPGRLLNLRVLSISNNRLKRLPEYVAQMRHLKILKIENNQLVWPPPHVATVPQVATGVVDGLIEEKGELKLEEKDRAKERERLVAARRKAEDRAMNLWIKELQDWIQDHRTGSKDETKGADLEAPESDVLTLLVPQPQHDPASSNSKRIANEETSEEKETDASASLGELLLQMPIPRTSANQPPASNGSPASPATPLAGGGIDRTLSPPPPTAEWQEPAPVPPLPAQYSPIQSPSIDSINSFKSQLSASPEAVFMGSAGGIGAGSRQPTLAELVDSPLDESLPPPPIAPFALSGSAGKGHSRDVSVSSGSSASSSSQTKIAGRTGRPMRKKSSNDSSDVAGPGVEPSNRWHMHTATAGSDDGSTEPASPETPDTELQPASRVSSPRSTRKLQLGQGRLPSEAPAESKEMRSPPSSTTPLKASGMPRPPPSAPSLLPSASFKRAPSGLRKLSLPSTVAAQAAAAEAITTPPSSSAAFATPEGGSMLRRTPSSRSQYAIQRTSPTTSTTPYSAGGANANGTASVDSERNSYFKRLSTLAPASAPNAIPVPVLMFIDATRGLLFALSQMHTALKQYVLFTLDERISAQFNRILEVAGSSMAGLIRALDRFDAFSRKGLSDAGGMVRMVLQACKDSVSTFRRVAGVLQLQLRPLQQTADVRYSRTFLLMLYGTIVELGNSWKMMAPHIEAVRPFLQGAMASAHQIAEETLQIDKPRSDNPLTPIAEGIDVGETRAAPATAGATVSYHRAQKRRHAGSFSSRDVAQGALLFAATAPASSEQFDRHEMERSRSRRTDSEEMSVRSAGVFDSGASGVSGMTNSMSAESMRTLIVHDRDGSSSAMSANGFSTPASAAEVWHTPMSGGARTAPLQWQQKQPPLAKGTPGSRSATTSMKETVAESTLIDAHLLDLVDKVTMTSASVWAGLLGQSLDEDIAHFQSRSSAAAACVSGASSSSLAMDDSPFPPTPTRSGAPATGGKLGGTASLSTNEQQPQLQAKSEASGSTLGDKLAEVRTKAMECDRMTGLLRSTWQECKVAFERLAEGAEEEECVARMWEEVHRLVRTIVQISMTVKAITTEYSFSKDLLRTLGALTTACTELMIHMHFLSPETMKRAAASAATAV